MGKRTGNPLGRPVGSKNKASVARQQAVAASGLTPLDYMLGVLRDGNEPPDRRSWAAAAAAPYVHPKLAQVELGNKDGQPLEVSIVDYRSA